MRHNGFVAFILTHGRPDRVLTYEKLRKHGYTGKIYIVCDDEDKTLPEYRKRFGDVLVFSKSEIAKTFDEGDNFGDRRAIIYARNACFELARQIGATHFIELDDDYTYFKFRFDDQLRWHGADVQDLDAVFDMLLDYFNSAPMLTLAIGQGGDYIGGCIITSNGDTPCRRYCANRLKSNDQWHRTQAITNRRKTAGMPVCRSCHICASNGGCRFVRSPQRSNGSWDIR